MDKNKKIMIGTGIVVVGIILWLFLRQKASAQVQAQNLTPPEELSTNSPTAQDWNFAPYPLKVPSFIINQEIIDAQYPLYYWIINLESTQKPKQACGVCSDKAKPKMLNDYIYNQ